MPYKTEKGVSPRAEVEGKMPSGLVNHNTQGECAITLYMAFWSNKDKTLFFKGGGKSSILLEAKDLDGFSNLFVLMMLEEKHTV